MESVSTLLKNKTLESVFNKEINYDSKKKLNVMGKKIISKEIIESIESDGVTSETLETLGVPIFKYGTQVTLHGDFSYLSNSYSFGYKNLILNKNKSLGVKYGAIDAIKRQTLAKLLSLLGISYYKSSTENYFFKTLYLDSVDNFNELVELKEKVLKVADLFVGNVFLYKLNFLGRNIGILKFNINIIKTENIETVARGIGWNEVIQKEYETKQLEKERLYNEKENRSKENRLKTQNELIAYIDSLGLKLTESLEPTKDVKFIKPTIIIDFDSDNSLGNVYKVKYVTVFTFMLPRKKFVSKIEKEFESLNEAIHFIENNTVDTVKDSMPSYYEPNLMRSRTTNIILF